MEYAACVLSPYKNKINKPDRKCPKHPTKLIPSLKKMEYEDRLRKLQLPTLKYRRLRGDMIELFKIVKGFYDKEATNGIVERNHRPVTRGHPWKLLKQSPNTDLRKFTFANRVVDLWNDLPSS